MADRIVRVECCATKAIADTRRGYLEESGFTVTVVENALAFKMQPQTPDELDGSELIFGATPCAYILIAVSKV